MRWIFINKQLMANLKIYFLQYVVKGEIWMMLIELKISQNYFAYILASFPWYDFLEIFQLFRLSTVKQLL